MLAAESSFATIFFIHWGSYVITSCVILNCQTLWFFSSLHENIIDFQCALKHIWKPLRVFFCVLYQNTQHRKLSRSLCVVLQGHFFSQFFVISLYGLIECLVMRDKVMLVNVILCDDSPLLSGTIFALGVFVALFVFRCSFPWFL